MIKHINERTYILPDNKFKRWRDIRRIRKSDEQFKKYFGHYPKSNEIWVSF